MKNSVKLVPLCLAVLAGLQGCSMTINARIYDLGGSGGVANAEFKWTGSGTGPLTGSLPDGESFRGEYTTVASGITGWGTTFSSVYTVNLSSDLQRGSAIATGNRGTVIDCEYVVRSGSATGYGVCRDNKKRTYRLMFGG